ncbi:MAG: FAD-dependent oxidoreductase [Opitutales bacterium]
MIADTAQLTSGSDLHADVCIVGGGVAGLILAKELVVRGRRVTILESGDRSANLLAQSLNHGDNVGYPYYPLDLVRERRLGGTSLRWGIDLGDGREGVRLRPLDPIDFEARPEIPHSGWPFGLSELEPYYRRAHPYFGLETHDYRPETWQRPGSHETFPLEGTVAETTLFQFGDPSKIHESLRRELEADERVEIVLNATALELGLSETGDRIERIRLADPNKREGSVLARDVVLATGGIEAPRLLLLSNRQQPEGLGNRHDLVGRYFMEHPHFLSGTLVPDRAELFRKSALYAYHRSGNTDLLGYLKLRESTIREHGLLNYCVSLWPRCSLDECSRDSFLCSQAYAALRRIRSAIHIGERPGCLRKQLSHLARQSNELLLHFFNKVTPPRPAASNGPPVAFQLHHMSEQAPAPESRVTLSDERDRYGQRRVRLDWRLSELDLKTIRRSQELLDQALRQSGVGHLKMERLDQGIPPGITGGLHHMGTTRMHADPRRGVVDADCTVHGIANLHVAGSSVFPTSGCANPTLTIAALAIRLADHLKHPRS